MTSSDQNAGSPLKTVFYVVVTLLSLIGAYTIAEPLFSWLPKAQSSSQKTPTDKVAREDPASLADPALEERIKKLRPVTPHVNKAIAAKTYAVPTFPNTKVSTAPPLQNDITTTDPDLEKRLKTLKPVVPRVNKSVPAKNYETLQFPDATAGKRPNLETDITKVDPALEERLRNLNPPTNNGPGKGNGTRQQGQTKPADSLPNPGTVSLPDPGRISLPN